MAKRKILMKGKIQQAIKAGHEAVIVMPSGMKRASLKKIFEKHTKPKP